MDKSISKEHILVFLIQNLHVGISLNITQRVIHAVEISPLPGAPSIVDGVINLGGDAIPILNIRKRLNLETRDIEPSDKIVIVKTDDFSFGYFTDDVTGLKEIELNNIKKSSDVLPGTNVLIDGIIVIEDDMVFIHDVNKFLSLKEKEELKNALSEQQSSSEE